MKTLPYGRGSETVALIPEVSLSRKAAGGQGGCGILGDYDDWNETRFSIERRGDGGGLAAIPGTEWVGDWREFRAAGGVWAGEEYGVEDGGAVRAVVTGGSWGEGVFDGERERGLADAGV